MRFLIIFLFGLIDLVAVGEDLTYFIGTEQAGIVKIGDEAEDVYRLFPKERRQLIDLELEGSLSPALALKLAGSTIEHGIIAQLLPRDNKLIVWRIGVHDPAMKTAKGIGVGSTMKDLRSSYEIEGIYSGEGGIVAYVESLSASFELDPKWFYELVRVKDPKKVPDEVKIVSVLLISKH